MTTELTHKGQTVRVAAKMAAPAARAWQAWTDNAHLTRWFADQVEGQCKPGETLTWKFNGFDLDIRYKVMSVEDGKRLVLGPAETVSPFLLEISIEDLGESAVVRVIHSGLGAGDDPEDEVAGIESGWQMALGILKHYLENHWGEDRQTFFAVREAQFTYSQLIGFYREEFKLAKWLTNEGAIVEGRPTVKLVLRDGRFMSGPVLAETSREIALAWDEINGVIEFKAFSLAPGRRAVCIRGCGWGLSSEEARVIESSMEGALERLVAALE